jgi:type IV pilus assembly protein PilE
MIAATLYMQRYYAATGSYSAASLTTAKLDKAPKDTTSAAKTYDLTLEIGGDSQSYTITATPVKTDADCGSLTLTDTGAKGVTAANGSVANCWR